MRKRKRDNDKEFVREIACSVHHILHVHICVSFHLFNILLHFIDCTSLSQLCFNFK
jgi:hypothetical protein